MGRFNFILYFIYWMVFFVITLHIHECIIVTYNLLMLILLSSFIYFSQHGSQSLLGDNPTPCSFNTARHRLFQWLFWKVISLQVSPPLIRFVSKTESHNKKIWYALSRATGVSPSFIAACIICCTSSRRTSHYLDCPAHLWLGVSKWMDWMDLDWIVNGLNCLNLSCKTIICVTLIN
jgi:hypothetical protein